ncbi:MAG: MarR family transcriptional regulator [Bacteroidota bacterium]
MEHTDLLDRLADQWSRERPDLDPSGMAIVGRLVMLGETCRRRAAEAIAPYQIGYTDLDVLATLRRHGAPYTLRPADLLKAVLIQSGSLTACLDRLAGASLVERVPTPNDRRSRSVKLTEKGRDLIDRAIEARFNEANRFVSELSTTDRDQLAGLLRTLMQRTNTAE